MTTRNFKKEYINWIPITDFYIWACLKAVEGKKQAGIRDLRKTIGIGSYQTFCERVRMLKEMGLITSNYRLTKEGRKLLKAFDTIGEIAEKVRKRTHSLGSKFKVKRFK